MTSPLVSVIIPTYNRCDLVQRAIASVRSQTWRNFQLIVVDDGSEDGTVETLEKTDVELVIQPHSGQARARNAGLARAQGELVCCLDADDQWYPEFLQESVGALLELKAVFAFASWDLQVRDGQPSPGYLRSLMAEEACSPSALESWFLLTPEQARSLYVDKCPSPSSSVLMRRTWCRGWKENLRIGDDWCLLMEMCLRQAGPVVFTPKALWLKCVQEDNIYDRRDSVEVLRWLHSHDIRCMRDSLQSRLTRGEYSRLSARLVWASFQLYKVCPGEQRIHLRRLIADAAAGLFCDPFEFWKGLKRVSPRLRQVLGA